jgi:hydroxymethylglutaryl-CoA reductase
MTNAKTSQISKFYKKSLEERRTVISEWIQNSDHLLTSANLSLDQADHMVENVIGLYELPFGIATNFLVNQRDYLIPMVVEEPSVIAAASNAAKMFRDGGGFITSSSDPIMIGQMQILNVPDLVTAVERLKSHQDQLLERMNSIGGSIISRGGGAKSLETRILKDTAVGDMLILHVLYDTRDAMGANAVNTAVELIAEDVTELTGGRVHLKILSNLADHRTARAEGVIPRSTLATDNMTGDEVVDAVLEAALFAEVDPYRATTHNKGIMNGIDPVVIATGNDWRAVEAGAHAFAARSGSYTSMTRWRKTPDGDLHGSIELPMAVGIVGGATRVHPGAQLALKILGVNSARELAEVMVAVGLAQNFAAMRALSTEGIQRGHMRLHARQLAAAAGAEVALIPKIAAVMIQENNIRLERAKELVQMYQQESASQ